jgi:hypothetical protein
MHLICKSHITVKQIAEGKYFEFVDPVIVCYLEFVF